MRHLAPLALAAALLSSCAPGPTPPSPTTVLPSATASGPATSAPNENETPDAEPSEMVRSETPAAEPKPYDPVISEGPTGTIVVPSFSILPFGESDDTEELQAIDLSHLTEEEQRLYLAFNSAEVPANECTSFSADVFDSPEQFHSEASELTNCLIDSWRPWAEQAGIDLPAETDVIVCDAYQGECSADLNSAVVINDTVWYGADYSRDPWTATVVAVHETAHVLQNTIRTSPDRPDVAMAGLVFGPGAGTETARRWEIQAQCLAVGMMYRGMGVTHESLEVAGYLGDGDELHWDADDISFWTDQGMLGQVGECNAIIADTALVDYTTPDS